MEYTGYKEGQSQDIFQENGASGKYKIESNKPVIQAQILLQYFSLG